MSEDYFNDQPQPEGGGTQTATDFFESGSPSCRFKNIGDAHSGVILSFENAQQRDIQTGEPKFWKDGNKCEMLVITLQTNERDPEIDDDDGQRRLYVNKPSGMFAAIKQALGKNKFTVGATLAVKYVKNGKPKQAGFSPPKEYESRYILPTGAVTHDAPQSNAGNGKIADPNSPKTLAWKAFCLATPEMDKDTRSDSFLLATEQYFGKGFEPSEITAETWAAFVKDLKADWNPIRGFPMNKRKRPASENPFTEPHGAESEFADAPF